MIHIQNFIYQSFFCILRDYIYCNCKKQWRQHRPLMHTTYTKNSAISQIQLKLSVLSSDRGSSLILQLFLVNLSFSLPIPSPFLELYQMPSQYPQNTHTTFSSYSYISLAFFILQTMRLSFLFQAQKPNCIESIFTNSSFLFSSTLSTIFMACSISFTPL